MLLELVDSSDGGEVGTLSFDAIVTEISEIFEESVVPFQKYSFTPSELLILFKIF